MILDWIQSPVATQQAYLTPRSPALTTFSPPSFSFDVQPLPRLRNPGLSFFVEINRACYTEVVHWQKNTFTVAFDTAGRKFVFELSELLRAYTDGTVLESIALMASTALFFYLV